MSGRPVDVAEDGLPGGYLLAVAHERMNVPVLERAPVARADADPLARDDRHSPVDHGVDGRSVRSGDVDALMEREAALPMQEGTEGRRPVELHAGITEVGADRMLFVEGLDRIAEALARDGLRSGGPGRPCELRAGIHRAGERERRGCCDGDGGRKGELREGRPQDAAPCAADWMGGVASHAATVRPGPNRSLTAG